MRWLTLLLCLLIVSALRWLVESAKPTATAAQDDVDVVLPKTQSTLEAVNTGSNTTPTSSMGTQDAAWIPCEPPSAAADSRPQLTNTMLSRTNRLMEFIEMGAGRMIENPLTNSDRA